MAEKIVTLSDPDPGMQKLKKTDLGKIAENWNLCMNCAACYYHGPLIPHNWLELPPEEWAAPIAKCPSYEFFEFKAYTPNGRLNLATVIFSSEKFPVTEDLMEIVYTCDTCGMCNSVCPTYHPVDTILALRETLVKRGARRPSAIEKIDKNIEKTGNMFGAKTSTKKKLIDVPQAGKDIFFAGCNALFLKTGVVNASLKTLKAAGLNISCLGNKEKCCGFVPGHDGNTALLEKQAAENVKMMKEAGAERIIVSCSHCLKAWKIDYPKIDDSYRFEVVHIAELYCNLIEKGKLKFKKNLNKKISFHDPCYLGRHSKVSFDVPRDVIKALPGVELKELQRNKKWSYCCGSGAKISSAVHPEMAGTTTKSRFTEAKKIADIIVTACTSCSVHMDKVIKKEDMDIKVYDLPAIVAEAMVLKV